MKMILTSIWKKNLEGHTPDRETLEKELCGSEPADLGGDLDGLVKNGLVKKQGTGYAVTEKGRERFKVVICGGVFDILHPGHVFILSQAKSYGDVLIVIVARDSTVERRKRIPIVPENQRVEMVGHLKPVDLSLLGYEGDPLKIIERIRPDIIALGPDQHHDEDRIKENLRDRGLDLTVKRIREYRECELNSTQAILQQIIERGYPNP